MTIQTYNAFKLMLSGKEFITKKTDKLLNEISELFPYEYEYIIEYYLNINKINNKYHISSNNNNKISILISKFSYLDTKPTNKTEMSNRGNTHSIKSDISHLVIYQENGNLNIIKFNKEIYNLDFNTSDTLFIIENLEPFHKFFLFNKKADYIYGNGRNILSSHFNKFFSEYKNIYTFFDIDNQGFRMYLNLKHKHRQIINFYPDNIEKYFEHNIKTFEHNILNFNDFLQEELLTDTDRCIIKLVDKYNTGLEQEVFYKELK